jgi:genome maintenance exonuclease 1
MKIVNKYEYPSSSRANISGLRHYTIDGTEEKLPSVTTVLGQTQPKEKQESLERWRQRVGLREAREGREWRGREEGEMHKYLEDEILGQRSLDLTPLGVEATNMAKIIMERGLNDCSEVYGTEATLYYPGLYAGSVDLIAKYKDQVSIIDFKQTNKPKQREWIGDYFLQMAAYGMAHDAVYGTNIEQGVIMMCSKDGFYQQFVIEGKEFRDAKHKFLERLNEFYNLGNNSAAVVRGDRCTET